MRKILFILLFLFSSSAYADCIDWGWLITKYEIDQMPKGRRALVVQPFEDFTKVAGDEWLSIGIPTLLADYLSTATDINILSGAIAKYHPGVSKATYTINGMFQHVDGKLRIFVKLLQSGNLKKQFQLDVVYPQNRQFFDTVGDTALEILAVVSPPYDREKFKLIREATGSVQAYENYIHGLISYRSFDPDQADVAKTWFEESKKADVYFQNAYKGLVDLYVFMALYKKQNRGAFATYFELAEQELVAMERFAKRLPPPKRPREIRIKMKEEPVNLTNRFLIGHSFFVAGLSAAGQKQWLEAARQFESSLSYVPEDAITWQHLSQMREKTGDKHKAKEAKARALELNKCLQ